MWHLVLIILDHVMTFTDEVQRVWRRKFSGATLIYLITRYVATFERITLMTSLFLQTNSDQVCLGHMMRAHLSTEICFSGKAPRTIFR